jgi:hypothetical protein
LTLSCHLGIGFLNGKNENLIEIMLLKLNPQELSVLICFKNLKQFGKTNPAAKSYLIYGGNEFQKRSDATVLGFNNLNSIYA